jgi:molybdopterin synthase catalytic subunit
MAPSPGVNRGGYTDLMAAYEVGVAPLDMARAVSAVERAADGAIVTFLGVARDHNAGRRVRWLEYEAYIPLAIKSFEQIGDEAAARWPGVALAIHHRTGRVEIGEASVVIAAASAHRAEAFAVCRYAIERLKQIAPIWKHEYFEGGESWIEGATADPEDDAAREAAVARVCA